MEDTSRLVKRTSPYEVAVQSDLIRQQCFLESGVCIRIRWSPRYRSTRLILTVGTSAQGKVNATDFGCCTGSIT